ncbi:MAG: 3-methylornithyl-N6-L-lysine dehydrogenase PylD [Desulfobacterales bacterium]|nr:3-methylornithyl-N6-L-lysine dehydrogenase PylD [Desulfobacterales bacterium]
MTRLRSEDITASARDLRAYDAELRRKVGTDLKGLACGAAGVDEGAFARRAAAAAAAVVPVTAGAGIITGFSAAVGRILAHVGLAAFVTAQTDVAGLAEAYHRACELIFTADDHSFVAIHTRRRRVVSNAEATGAGFARGLDLMAGGVRGRPVLVVGCGPVGRSAAENLLGAGAVVHVHDADGVKARRLAAEMGGRSHTVAVEKDFSAALARHTLILDATPAAGIIDADAVGPATCISAPGVPIGLTPAARAKVPDRVLHDFLEIGVATMAALSLKDG